MNRIPQKASYRVNEVCQYTDTQPYVLRFWESEFPQLKPAKSRTGQSVYSRDDLELVLRIKRLLNDEEHSISDARRLLEQDGPEAAGPKAGTAEPKVGKPKAAQAKQAKARTPRPATAQPRVRRAEVPAPTAETGPADSIPRERYQDAIDEIAHLRLELNDLETRQRKAEAVADKALETGQAQQERIERASEILEQLIQRLS